ncbi:HPP family protein [Salinirubrum litoreum]|uniref:HPP family protein n=1 Tax=Salinirubrum litoreum TaxID=1126234 RepID=A0ABD5RCL4_9EURY
MDRPRLAPDRLGPALRHGLHAGGLLAVLGVAVVASGRPLLFPSLGPTAYVLAVHPDSPPATPRRVLGGHAVGTVPGFLAYHLLAAGLVVTDPPTAFSAGSLRLAASATVAVAATTAAMRATDYRHAPACATTLIVALGLMPTATDAGLILLAVGVVVAVDALFS